MSIFNLLYLNKAPVRNYFENIFIFITKRYWASLFKKLRRYFLRGEMETGREFKLIFFSQIVESWNVHKAKNLGFAFLKLFCVHVCMCALCPWRSGPLKLWVKYGFKPPFGPWDLNLRPLQEQQVLLTVGLSLYPLLALHFKGALFWNLTK